MSWHSISHAAAFIIRAENILIGCLGIQLEYAPYAAASILRIFTSKSLPSMHVAASAIACCDMVFSYMFQCLGIISSMLGHTPCVFPSCCNIELLCHGLTCILINLSFLHIFTIKSLHKCSS